MSSKATWRLCIFGALILQCGGGFSGCTRVDSAADIARVSELAAERSIEADLYDPAVDDTVSDRVGALLADGLTLEEAVQVALLNNRSFQSLFYEIGASRADVVQSTLLTNPSLSFMSRFPEGGGIPNIEIGIGQELVDLWQIPVRKKVAEAKLQQVVLQVAQRTVQLRAEVKTSAYEVLAARRAEETAEESRQLVTHTHELLQRQREAGEISQFEVNLDRGNVIDANLEVIDFRRQREAAQIALARILGISGGLQRVDVRDALPEPGPVPPDAELLRVATEQRLDVQIASFEVDATEAEVQRQYLNIFPSLMAGFNIERGDQRALPSRKIIADTLRGSIASGGLTAPTIQSRAERDLERRQIIDAILGPTLQVTLPIWDQNQAQIAKARFAHMQARKRLEDLLNTIAAEVQDAAATARAAYEIDQFYDSEALPQAERNVESARHVYTDGEQGIMVLIEAQRSLVRRRAAHVDVLRRYAVAMAQLEAAVGGRLMLTPQTRPASSHAGRSDG